MRYQSEANGKFVSTEYTFTYPMDRVLRARASVDGTWEHYYLGVPCNWTMDLQTVYIGRYVSAELDYPGSYDPGPGNYKGLLRGRAKEVGPWEQFGPGCAPG